MVWQLVVDALHKLKEVGDLSTVRWSELFVQLNDNPQANQDIFFIFKLKQFKSQREDVLGIWFQLVICWKPLYHFQNQFSHLLDVQLCYEVACALLEQFQEDSHGMVQESLVLCVPNDDIKAVIQLLSCLQLAFIFSLAVTQDIEVAAHTKKYLGSLVQYQF